MGYHVHILRTNGAKSKPILRSEIEKLVEDSPHLTIQDRALKSAEFDLVVTKSGVDVLRLIFQHGQLWSKNPTPDEINQVINIANRLGARVRGDELETYRSLIEVYNHPDDLEEIHRAKQRSVDYLKRHNQIKNFWLVVRIVLVLMLIAAVFIKK